MSVARYLGPHPEPSVSLPQAPKDGALSAWPIRNATGRNEVWAFPQGIWRPVPPLVALWLCAVRRREGPWFQVRFARGEFQAFVGQITGWGIRTRPRRERIRGARSRRRERARARRLGVVVKAKDVLRWTQPTAVANFLRGYRGRYTAGNAVDTVALTYDGATGQVRR